MKEKIIVFICILCVLVTVQSRHVLAADGSTYDLDGYIYDYHGVIQESPAAFSLAKVINEEQMGGIALSSVKDVETSKDGRIFLVDSVESRVNVFDETGSMLKSIKVLRTQEDTIALDAQGNQISFVNPEGIYIHEKNSEIYIADTGAGRIVVLDETDYYLKRIITKPENMSGVTEFKPSKITVDQSDRMYVVVQSSYEGIMELYEDGSFSRYFGVNTPRVNLFDYFWKNFASDEQKEKMGKTYAPAFNNVAMDYEGFVYAVTDDSSAADMVFRLNAKGENVLREFGNTSVVGDIYHTAINDRSKFVDVAVTDYGAYVALDAKRGRLFLYDYDGNLLNASQTIGNRLGDFKEPTGIAWLNDGLVVTDNTLKCAYIFEPTQFGQLALDASRYYYNGKWDEALACFQQLVGLNSNYEISYIGIGKNYLMKEEYEEAMEYFKLGNAHSYYSQAYQGYRNEQTKENFGIIASIVVIAIGMLFYNEYRYQKKSSRGKKV